MSSLLTLSGFILFCDAEGVMLLNSSICVMSSTLRSVFSSRIGDGPKSKPNWMFGLSFYIGWNFWIGSVVCSNFITGSAFVCGFDWNVEIDWRSCCCYLLKPTLFTFGFGGIAAFTLTLLIFLG